MYLSKLVVPVSTILAFVMAYYLLKNRKRILWAHEPFNYKTELNVARYLAPGFIYFNVKRIFNAVGLFKGHGNAIDYFLKTVRYCPNNTALICSKTGREWSYRELDQVINQMAHLLLEEGVGPGQVVAMFMENSPEFIFAWFALLKIGATAAFLNPNLPGRSLTHVLNVSGASMVITTGNDRTANLAESIQDVNKESMVIHKVLFFDNVPGTSIEGVETISIDLMLQPKDAPDSRLKNGVNVSDPAMLIYTSGTTGLPKAAIISHGRFALGMNGFGGFSRMSDKDRLYCALPLYHASAALGGVGSCFRIGAAFIISPKFSARNFFPECRKYKATMIQYIGELCRFLMATPPSDSDKDHQIHTAFGNGMRADVWLPFKQRFGIKVICEFYASTEGTSNMVNYQNNDKYGVGAMGRQGPLQAIAVPLAVIKVDAITEEPVRDSGGRCVQCEPNEIGELIGKIKVGDPFGDFKGYKGNQKQTQKKILENVFVKGDKWFRSGDLVTKDEYNFYYFKDRIGDTFRWRGENVSTVEVSGVLSDFAGVQDANIYGVQVPNAEGRAGMAAITVSDSNAFDISKLASFAAKSLPSYAVPLFIRLVKEMPSTSTMKQVKFHLVQEGFDPAKMNEDPLYWLPPKASAYEILTPEVYQKIVEGKFRL